MRRPFVAAVLALLGGGLAVSTAGSAAAAGAGRQLVPAGSVNLSALIGAPGAEGLSSLELPVGGGREEGGAEHDEGGPGVRVEGSRVKPAGPEMKLTFAGLNHRDQRLSDGGNQFSSEPPDQALCVGPGHVLEVINTAVRVFTKSGAPATPTVSLNRFLGYPSAFVRPAGPFGANIFDPVCHYDSDTGRFFVVADNLGQDPVSGDLTGKNTLDIAVSKSSDPTGGWFLYRLPIQNDGTDGTPNHGCDLKFCFGDYPHIGADRNGFFITTNEYSLFGDGTNGGAAYTGAQIYAISKRALAAGTSAPQVVQFENPPLGPFRSFTVWPAISPAGKASREANGTEYFLSSTLGDGSETGNTAASEDRIGVWAMSNTRSLDSASPNPVLTNKLIKGDTYAIPPKAEQKDGPAPLRDCLNDRSGLLGPGVDCWQLFFGAKPSRLETLSHLDAGDTRMQQTVYADGKIWGSLGTAVDVKGAKVGDGHCAGVLYLAVEVGNEKGRLEAKTEESGYVASDGNDITYPSLGLTSGGKVVMGVTVSGPDRFPSAGYVIVSGDSDKGVVKIASEGKGPHDGFTGYAAFVGDPPRTRWGDYGAAAMDGDTLWLANESIEQSCTLPQYLSGALGSCGRTRTALANWGTRITALSFGGRSGH